MDADYCARCGARVRPLPDADGPARDPAASAAQPLGARVRRQPPAADWEAELDLWTGRYSAKAMVGTVALMALATLLGLVGATVAATREAWLLVAILVVVAWIGLGVVVAYRKWSLTYRLTNYRLIHESGILRRVTNRVDAIDMEDITHEQGLLDRFLGVGTIRIVSSDQTHPLLILRGIDRVTNVAAVIDQARRKERMKRGLHLESS